MGCSDSAEDPAAKSKQETEPTDATMSDASSPSEVNKTIETNISVQLSGMQKEDTANAETKTETESKEDKEEEFTLEQVAAKKYTVIRGVVYDLKGFGHPGGPNAIERTMGTDATAGFERISSHASISPAMASPHRKGVLKDANNDANKDATKDVEKNAPKEDKIERIVKLIAKKQVSPDSHIFTFEQLAGQESLVKICVPNGAHIYLCVKDEEGNVLERPYTPISCDGEKGQFEVLIKCYPQGAVSSRIDKLAINDEITIHGPYNSFDYEAAIDYFVDGVYMIAGGSGLTPMYQLIQAVFERKEYKKGVNNQVPKLVLCFSNKMKEDCLLKDSLLAFEKENETFSLFNFLTREKEDIPWAQKGRLDAKSLATVCPALNNTENTDRKICVCLCGPPRMVSAMEDILKTWNFKLGLDNQLSYFVF